jgi:hypothetical protein
VGHQLFAFVQTHYHVGVANVYAKEGHLTSGQKLDRSAFKEWGLPGHPAT